MEQENQSGRMRKRVIEMPDHRVIVPQGVPQDRDALRGRNAAKGIDAAHAAVLLPLGFFEERKDARAVGGW